MCHSVSFLQFTWRPLLVQYFSVTLIHFFKVSSIARFAWYWCGTWTPNLARQNNSQFQLRCSDFQPRIDQLNTNPEILCVHVTANPHMLAEYYLTVSWHYRLIVRVQVAAPLSQAVMGFARPLPLQHFSKPRLQGARVILSAEWPPRGQASLCKYEI